MRSRLTHKLNKVIFRLSPVLAERCNIDFKLETPSRAFMENEIFSYVNRLVRAANQRHRLLFFLGWTGTTGTIPDCCMPWIFIRLISDRNAPNMVLRGGTSSAM